MKVEFCPIQSYHKATLVQLFANEGEAPWSHEKLNKAINDNASLKKELADTGYNSNAKSFTGQQITILFRYIGQPILNAKNRKLLKIKHKLSLLEHFEAKLDKLSNMELLNNLSDAVLSDLGLRKKTGGDFNEHYIFTENDNYFFFKKENCFELRHNDTLKVVVTIETTESLIKWLLTLKNE